VTRLWLLLLLLLEACAQPREQVYLPMPAERTAQLLQGRVVMQDGVSLPLRYWLPEGRPRVVILALHGFNDHSHAFELPAEYMRLYGVAWFAYDQRGFGGAPQPGIWPNEANLTRDAVSVLAALKARYPDTPVFLLGESMGGAVAVMAALRPDFPPIDGVILIAPALWGGESFNPLYRTALWSFVHVWPSKRFTGEGLHILACDNIELLRQIAHDPLFLKSTRADAIYGLVHLMDHAYQGLQEVKTPVLLLYGAHDQVIPSGPIVKAARKAGPNLRSAYYPLGYHMLLRDLNGDVPVRDLLSWVYHPNAPLPSGDEVIHAAALEEKARSNDLLPLWLETVPMDVP
jgi:alpha-beta hydrolase superfamily lysophospholipase